MRVLLCAGFVAVLLTGCMGSSDVAIPDPSPDQPTKLTSSQARALLDSDRRAVLIDARSLDEYIHAGHLVGAQTIDAGNDAMWRFRVAMLDRDRPTIIYGGTTEDSRAAAQRLVDDGLTKVYNLGPPSHWDKKLLPTDRGQHPERIPAPVQDPVSD